MKILNFCRFLLPKLRNLVFANSVRLNNIASQIHKVSSCKDTGRIIKQYNNKTIFLFFLAFFLKKLELPSVFWEQHFFL